MCLYVVAYEHAWMPRCPLPPETPWAQSMLCTCQGECALCCAHCWQPLDRWAFPGSSTASRASCLCDFVSKSKSLRFPYSELLQLGSYPWPWNSRPYLRDLFKRTVYSLNTCLYPSTDTTLPPFHRLPGSREPITPVFTDNPTPHSYECCSYKPYFPRAGSLWILMSHTNSNDPDFTGSDPCSTPSTGGHPSPRLSVDPEGCLTGTHKQPFPSWWLLLAPTPQWEHPGPSWFGVTDLSSTLCNSVTPPKQFCSWPLLPEPLINQHLQSCLQILWPGDHAELQTSF